MMMLTECVIERSFPGDRLRVAVVELYLRVDVHAAMRAVVFVGLDLAIGALPGEVLTLLRCQGFFDWPSLPLEEFLWLLASLLPLIRHDCLLRLLCVVWFLPLLKVHR